MDSLGFLVLPGEVAIFAVELGGSVLNVAPTQW